MSLFKNVATSALTSTMVVVGSLAFSLGIQTLLLSPAHSDAGIPLTSDPQERAAVQAEIDGCGKDPALFLKRLDLHATSAKAAYSDALKDMNPVVRRAAAAFCFETEQEILVRTMCYARALDRMESDVSQVRLLRAQPGNSAATLLESLIKTNHFAGKVLYQQCTPSGGSPTDACVELNLLALREQLVDAYNEMSASFDEMSRWSVISSACNSSLPGAPCRAAYAARVKEAQNRIDEGRKKNPKGFVYNASQADFFAPSPASVAYDPIYALPGLTGKFQAPDRIDTIIAGRSYRSGPRKPLLPGKGSKKHTQKPGTPKGNRADVIQFGPPIVPKGASQTPKSSTLPGNKSGPAAKKPAKKPTKKPAPKSAPVPSKPPAKPPTKTQAKPSVSPAIPPVPGAQGASGGTRPPKPPGDEKIPSTPVNTPLPSPSSAPVPPPADPVNPTPPGGTAPGGQGDQPGGNAAGDVANRDQATNLDCSAEAQGETYRPEARLTWSKANFSEMYPRRMLGQSKLYACYVKEFYAHNDQAVMLANAAMAISATAKVVLPVQDRPSIAGARRACTEAKSLIKWMDDSLTTLERTHPRAEIAPLRAEVAGLSGQDCMPLVTLISDDGFAKKLNDQFCAWKAAVETEEPRSTLGFPSAIAKCAP